MDLKIDIGHLHCTQSPYLSPKHTVLRPVNPCKVQKHRVVLPASPALVDALTYVVHNAPFGYEPVAAPCSLMKCGDVIYRSTLDLALRKEEVGLDWRGLVLLASAMGYLLLPPGPMPGAYDYYIARFFKKSAVHGKEDIVLGRKLATGGFGTVFKGQLKAANGKLLPVIVKRAKEFGEAEVWMNERMMRLRSKNVAEFITALDVEDRATRNVQPEKVVWLVWHDEGSFTVADLMMKRDFPYNLEPLLYDRPLRLAEGTARTLVTIRLVMKQLLESLVELHSTGIVHRDIKPQNCIISERDKRLKLIDLGAAADLRIGINYAPSEYLMDPRYAPPEQYVMSTQTPRPPPKPVAAFLSPVLWAMESPDRFDMYSVGITMMQLAFPGLRSDDRLIAFNKRLTELKHDLRRWRKEEEQKAAAAKKQSDMMAGFELLDADEGAGWALAERLLARSQRLRPSAAEALLHPFITGAPGSAPVPDGLQQLMATAGKVTEAVSGGAASALNTVMGDSSAVLRNEGTLTEAFLKKEFEKDLNGIEGPDPAMREASQTIAWWQERQTEQRRQIEARRSSGNSAGSSKVVASSKAAAKTPGSGGKAPSSNAKAGSSGKEVNIKASDNGAMGGLGKGLVDFQAAVRKSFMDLEDEIIDEIDEEKAKKEKGRNIDKLKSFK